MIEDGTYDSYGKSVKKDSGYWVALAGFETKVRRGVSHPSLNSALVSLTDYYKDLSRLYDSHYGIWTDPKGNVFFDLSTHIEHLDLALSVAKDNGQQAIWDIANNRSIEVPKDTLEHFPGLFVHSDGAYKATSSLSQEHARAMVEQARAKNEKNDIRKD